MRSAECRIKEVRDFGEEYYQLILEKPSDMTFAPGQFVTVIDRESPDLLRRPFSVASEAEDEFTLLIKEVGSMSRRLRNLRVGDILDVLGPLGKGFVTNNTKKAVIVGGGVGIAPLLRLSQVFEGTEREYVCLLGFRDAYEPADLFVQDHLRIHRESVDQGFVTDLLCEEVDDKSEVFACGPLPMLEKIRTYCMDRGIPVQLSLEERMACGVGACIGCAVGIVTDGDLTYKKVCSDGPVFRGEELAWK